jgi:hypothetical protein
MLCSVLYLPLSKMNAHAVFTRDAAQQEEKFQIIFPANKY